ncbi:OLC1v1002610C1 [Oldenlandia corymbosa var. corymbosa]|uniref:OLC1v1002610C1 n=1 Tax=Oldenlandia corymbosa var. corymbosa TaxID=529605 RepID=A0AAV1DAW9_OLDCO|nr:OLC1v1002610C1 [Oldenlandia corymbosa var. corymbosa]
MSLNLLQGYSSSSEEEELNYDDSIDEEDAEKIDLSLNRYQPLSEPNPPSGSSLLPSALEAFSEVSGPPEFLNNSIQEVIKDEDGQNWRHGRRRKRRDKNDLPAGAVLEAKPQLIGIHERVRSDVEGNISIASSSQPTTANNPDGEKVVEVNRFCLNCGVPKTYSSSKGTLCPICGDTEPKKKGSAVKDKEKLKRMKGQSSHATWKSETEMHLRQQFD